MGPVQGHQCPYDAPSVAEHFRKTGTVNLNPANALLFRDSLTLLLSSGAWQPAESSESRRAMIGVPILLPYNGRCDTW